MYMLWRFVLTSVYMLLLAATLFVAGFVFYLLTLPTQVDVLPADIKHVAVLTGGHGRVPYGLELLRQQKDMTVLITGVNPQTSLADLTQGHDLTENHMMRLVLDHQAATTRENVSFVSTWAQQHHISRIGIVTSQYHMPRVRFLFAVYAPQLDILPLPVEAATPGSFFVREYVKLLVAPLLK